MKFPDRKDFKSFAAYSRAVNQLQKSLTVVVCGLREKYMTAEVDDLPAWVNSGVPVKSVTFGGCDAGPCNADIGPVISHLGRTAFTGGYEIGRICHGYFPSSTGELHWACYAEMISPAEAQVA